MTDHKLDIDDDRTRALAGGTVKIDGVEADPPFLAIPVLPGLLGT